jgi:hypothetical protein
VSPGDAGDGKRSGSRGVQLAVVALVASVLANVGLVLRATAVGPEGGAAPPPPCSLVRPGEGSSPVAPARSSPPAAPAGDDRCRAQLGEVARQIQSAEQQLNRLLSSDQLFQRGEPVPELTRFFDSTLESFLAKDPTRRRSQHVECRQWACKWVVLHAVGDSTWTTQLHRDPEVGRHGGLWAFDEGRPVKDPLTGEALWETPVFFTIKYPGQARPGMAP